MLMGSRGLSSRAICPQTCPKKLSILSPSAAPAGHTHHVTLYLAAITQSTVSRFNHVIMCQALALFVAEYYSTMPAVLCVIHPCPLLSPQAKAFWLWLLLFALLE